MRQASRLRQRLAALGGSGLLLLTFPLVGLPAGTLAGLPAAMVYLFGVWAALIGVAAWLAERGRD